jgi:hypothetical protein
MSRLELAILPDDLEKRLKTNRILIRSKSTMRRVEGAIDVDFSDDEHREAIPSIGIQ